MPSVKTTIRTKCVIRLTEEEVEDVLRDFVIKNKMAPMGVSLISNLVYGAEFEWETIE